MASNVDITGNTARIQLNPVIRFFISVPDGQPEKATPFQGFAKSLCENSQLLGFIQQFPTNVFELTSSLLPDRIALRIAGRLPINWYGLSPFALKSEPIPLEEAFTVVMLDRSERVSDFDEWLTTCSSPVTLVAESGGHIAYSDLSFGTMQARFLKVCRLLRNLHTIENVDEIETAIEAWENPNERHLPYELAGHGTIFPNVAVLKTCGFAEVAQKPFSLLLEGEKAHVKQIVLSTSTIFEERRANPPSLVNQIYPRSPDLNLYLPATYDLKSAFSIRPDLDRKVRHEIETTLRILEKQKSYSFEVSSEAKIKALLGITSDAVKNGENPTGSPIMHMRQLEMWLGTDAVGCLAASEIGAVIRLPNRLNLTRGVVRQFAQHYRAERPQMLKRSELFRGVQRSISDGFPSELQALLTQSQDGIRVIADAHVEWLDVGGIPLGLRYDVSRIPVTPGNLLVNALSTQPSINLTPEDFQDVLVVSGLHEADMIAQYFKIAFEHFGKQWRDRLRVKFVRVSTRQKLIDALNEFEGMLMVFDGHGSHEPDQPGVLWIGEEAVDVWGLRGEVRRPPPIVVLSACDTHAADRNHATVANGFLALGSRSVLGSVFPLHAFDAAIFTARLLFRVSYYVPAAVDRLKRSLTWLEVVSGMLRRQLTTNILWHLESTGLIAKEDSGSMFEQMQWLVETDLNDPFSSLHQALRDYGIPKSQLDQEIYVAVAASSTISYLHLGRPETIIINSVDNLNKWEETVSISAQQCMG